MSDYPIVFAKLNVTIPRKIGTKLFEHPEPHIQAYNTLYLQAVIHLGGDIKLRLSDGNIC